MKSENLPGKLIACLGQGREKGEREKGREEGG